MSNDGVDYPHKHTGPERTGRDANGVPSVVGMGDGTITSDGKFVPDDAWQQP